MTKARYNVSEARRLSIEQQTEKRAVEEMAMVYFIRALQRFRRGVLRVAGRGDVGAMLSAYDAGWHGVEQVMSDTLAAALVTGYYRTVARAGRRLRRPRRFGLFDDMAKFWGKHVALRLDQLEMLSTQAGMAGAQIFKSYGGDLRDDLETTLSRTAASGAHPRESAKALREVFAQHRIYADPTVKATNALLATWARTGTMMAYSAGQWQAANDPDIAGILWGFRYVTMGDERVRDEHAGYDGMQLPKDDPIWLEAWPPNGWACRCDVIEIFDSAEQVGPHKVTVGEGDKEREIDPVVHQDFQFNPGTIFPAIAEVA